MQLEYYLQGLLYKTIEIIKIDTGVLLGNAFVFRVSVVHDTGGIDSGIDSIGIGIGIGIDQGIAIPELIPSISNSLIS